MKASVHIELSGAKLAPVTATRRPPSARRARAELDVTECGVGHAAIDVGHHREGRVHQHDARRDAGAEMIVDLRGVETGDGAVLKEEVEEPGACFRQLVENKRAAGKLRENGKQPGAGRRFQHVVGGRDHGGRAGGESEWDRRRELLQRLALLRAAGVGGEKVRDLREHRLHSGRRAGFAEKRLAVFA